MRLFDSKYYPTIMFLLILSVLVLILFNITNLLESSVNNPLIKGSSLENPISGLVTSIDFNPFKISNSETKAISKAAYIFYYEIILFLFLLIYVLIKFIYKR